MTDTDHDDPIHDFIAASNASGDPTGWFEHLYAAEEVDKATVPWDCHALQPVARRVGQPAATGKWRETFDLVVECQTVQSLSPPLHDEAIANVASFVAPGGTLIALVAAGNEDDAPHEDPPWPLTRTEIDRFAGHGLQPVDIAVIPDAAQPEMRR